MDVHHRMQLESEQFARAGSLSGDDRAIANILKIRAENHLSGQFRTTSIDVNSRGGNCRIETKEITLALEIMAGKWVVYWNTLARHSLKLLPENSLRTFNSVWRYLKQVDTHHLFGDNPRMLFSGCLSLAAFLWLNKQLQ